MAVAVVVAHGRAHAGLLASVFVEGRASGHGYVGERSVVVIPIENAGRAVASDKDVGPAVFIEIECRNAESVVAVCAIDMRLRRDVFKRSIAAIVVEDVLRSGEAARPTHHRNTFPDAGRPLARRRRRREIKVDVVRDH